MNQSPESWRARVLAAVTTLVVAAVGARIAWEALEPLLAPLIIAAVLLSILGWLVKIRRRW